MVSVDIPKQTDDEKGFELSPTKSGTSTNSTLSIECKKGDVRGDDYESLLWQLYANMVSASVEQFVKTVTTIKRQDLVNLKRIVGYGLVYTGAGDVGLYKLILEFGEVTQFIPKLSVGRYISFPIAASRVDDLLDYVINQILKLPD